MKPDEEMITMDGPTKVLLPRVNPGDPWELDKSILHYYAIVVRGDALTKKVDSRYLAHVLKTSRFHLRHHPELDGILELERQADKEKRKKYIIERRLLAKQTRAQPTEKLQKEKPSDEFFDALDHEVRSVPVGAAFV